MEIERKVTINHKQYANTVYIGNDHKIYTTNKIDLSNMSEIKKIDKIGYYFDRDVAVRIVKMPTHLTEVSEDLPTEIKSLNNAYTLNRNYVFCCSHGVQQTHGTS